MTAATYGTRSTSSWAPRMPMEAIIWQVPAANSKTRQRANSAQRRATSPRRSKVPKSLPSAEPESLPEFPSAQREKAPLLAYHWLLSLLLSQRTELSLQLKVLDTLEPRLPTRSRIHSTPL